MEAAKGKLLFILGINQRCGSNYLYNLLLNHPDCHRSFHKGEDYLIAYSDVLISYHDYVTRKWSKKWGNDPEVFFLTLSSGLRNYLLPSQSSSGYFITKTPVSDNILNFPKIFPDTPLLVIVRNGQDLVQSYMLTFKCRFDDAVRAWRKGAEQILAAQSDQDFSLSGKMLLIRYEDLYADHDSKMKEILEFLGLKVSAYDFEKSKNLAIYGSAIHRGGSKDVTWEAVPKDENFNPIGRSASWSRFRHYRFNWLAGRQSLALGYELKYHSHSPVYFLYNAIMSVYDVTYRAFRLFAISVHALLKGRDIVKEIRNRRLI